MRINLPSGIMSSRYFSGEDERAIGLEDLKNFSPANLGIDLSNLPTIDPESIQQMPASTTGGIPGLDDWWKEAGYPDAATAIQSGNFRYDMNRGWLPKEETSTNMGAMTSPTLGPLGTSGMSMMEGEPMTMTSESTMSPMIDSEVTLPSSDFVGMKAQDYQDFLDKLGSTKVDEELKNSFSTDQIDPVQAAVDAAVGNGQPTTDDTILNLDDMTVTSGLRDAMDNAKREESKTPFGFGENFYSGEGFIPPPAGSMNTMAIVDYYNPSTGQVYKTMSGGYTAPPGWISGTKEDYEGNKEYYDNILAGEGTGTDTGTQQPDFMTQLQELIAQMQGEQTAAAEAAAAAEAERQKQAAEMTQNYMVGQPAVGYNPYESGQYQNNPYGSAGVPDMGGITSIPVPAAYQPYQPPGGTT